MPCCLGDSRSFFLITKMKYLNWFKSPDLEQKCDSPEIYVGAKRYKNGLVFFMDCYVGAY